MTSIDLRDIDFNADIKAVGQQVAQEIANAGYANELKNVIKLFESGNIDALEDGFHKLYDYAKTHDIQLKESSVGKILKMARQVISKSAKLFDDIDANSLAKAIDLEFSSLVTADDMVDLQTEVEKLLQKELDDGEYDIDLPAYAKEITKAINVTHHVYYNTLRNELKKIVAK